MSLGGSYTAPKLENVRNIVLGSLVQRHDLSFGKLRANPHRMVFIGYDPGSIPGRALLLACSYADIVCLRSGFVLEPWELSERGWVGRRIRWVVQVRRICVEVRAIQSGADPGLIDLATRRLEIFGTVNSFNLATTPIALPVY